MENIELNDLVTVNLINFYGGENNAIENTEFSVFENITKNTMKVLKV